MDEDEFFGLEHGGGYRSPMPTWLRWCIGLIITFGIVGGLVWVIIANLPSVVNSTNAAVAAVNAPTKNTFDFSLESEIDDTASPVDMLSAYKGIPVSIVILGTDTRGTMSSQAALEGDSSDMRSDVMLQVTLTADRKHLVITSLMRDLWVYVPEMQDNAKLNAAFQSGGIPQALDLIAAQTGQKADHVVAVDFEGFKHIIDLLGGVTINNDIEFTATHLDHTFVVGEQTLTGEQALAYGRDRKSFSNGDYTRTLHHRMLLTGVAEKLLTSDVETTLKAFKSIVDNNYATIDNGLTNDFLLGFYDEMQKNDTQTVQVLFPTAGTGTESNSYISGQSVVYVDEARAAQYRAALTDGTIMEYVEANKGVNY